MTSRCPSRPLPGTDGFVAVLLAGGRSQRMGRDKALLDWQGRPLIEHMIALLEAAGATRVCISGDRPDYRGVADVQPGVGPVGGLASVAETLADGWLLVVPVDMPRLTLALLHALRQAPGSAARLGDYPLPMRVYLDAGSRAVLRELAAMPGRDCSLRVLQQRLAAVAVPLAAGDHGALGNCNTPDDWQQALRP